MSVLACASALLLALMLAVSVGNLLSAPRLERAKPATNFPPVSVLVPARNEATHLMRTLPALLELDYPCLEILVLDDGSEDGTAAVVERHRHGAEGRLRLIQGRPLPEGWLGKNWACHQLAHAATGEVLVFCDADVTARVDALRLTVAALEAERADALTALVRQRGGHWAGRAVVPLVAQLPVLAFLPLRLVPRTRARSLAMGNGQWFAFTREAYFAAGGHAAVRADVLEDVALARRVKAAGQRLLPVVAAFSLEVPTYPDLTALREGFGKNLYALSGGSPLPFLASLLVFALTAIFPWVGVMVDASEAGAPLALLAAVRICGGLLFRHDLGSVALHPVGSLLVARIALLSYVGSRRGRLSWKGRRIPSPLPAGPPPTARPAGK